MPGVGKKADAVADRSGVPLLYAPCLSLSELPLPGGKGGTPFPALKYSAPAPCRSGSKGEAPWSPKAKSRFKKLAHGVYSIGGLPPRLVAGRDPTAKALAVGDTLCA